MGRRINVFIILVFIILSFTTCEMALLEDVRGAVYGTDKDITDFYFSALLNNELPGEVIAIIDGTNITAVMPYGADRSALVAGFEIT